MALPSDIEEKIFYDAENLYNKLDELAREQDSYDFGLPMFNKEKQPIINLLTEYANRAQKLVNALKIVATWQLPPSGQFWDREQKEPMSYEAAYGSNGVRDFMRNVATQALQDWEKGDGV